MKFNLSIASLCLGLVAAAKNAKISEYAKECGIDNVLVAENCINKLNGSYYYSRSDDSCALEYVCMVPCSTDSIPTTKSLRFYTKGQYYCDIQSNIDVCQSDKKYYDYKQCLLISMGMEQLEEISSSLVNELKSTIETKTLAAPTTTATVVPTIIRKGSSNSPLKSNLKATQECAAENEPCGGSLYASAPHCCQEGLKCQRRNPYYSVCISE